MVRVANAASPGPLSQSGGSEGQNTCACAHARRVRPRVPGARDSAAASCPPRVPGRRVDTTRPARSDLATLATVTDAAAPRAADPDGPVPGHPAGADESADSAAAESDLAAALAAVAFADQRLAAFDASIRAMAGLLAVDRVLQVIVDRVRELVGAGYAALGIVDGEGVIEQFITSGMARAERALIGAPPRGLGVPVAIRGRTIGNLYLTEKAGGFTDADQQIVELFAGHAAIAMENARLHDQVQRLVIVEERERIGRDLHDGVIQSIYAVGLTLEDVPDLMVEDPAEASRRVERAIESLDQTIRDIRNFIFGLRPQLLDGVEMVEGLAALADEFRVNTLVDVELRAGAELDANSLGPERTLEVLSVVREALSNIARHARATRAEVLVATAEGHGLTLTIVDNGTGFDPDAPRGLGPLGLANMDARMTGIGGSLVIESSPDRGTRIIVRIPGDPSVGETEDGAGA